MLLNTVMLVEIYLNLTVYKAQIVISKSGICFKIVVHYVVKLLSNYLKIKNIGNQRLKSSLIGGITFMSIPLS